GCAAGGSSRRWAGSTGEDSMPRRVATALALLVPALAPGCGADRMSRLDPPMAPAAYVDPASEAPHVRYGDGQVSLNDLCPIRKGTLKLRMPAVYVNGRPVGFC